MMSKRRRRSRCFFRTAHILIISAADDKVGVAVIELSSIESEFGEVLLAKVTRIEQYTTTSWAAVRD